LFATGKNLGLIQILEMNQYIGKFDIAMQHVHFVDGFEALDNLAEEVPRLLLSKPASQLAQVI